MMRATLLTMAALALAGAASAAPQDKARDFLHDALQGDNSEVMLGKIAAEKGGAPEVKHYGQMLVDDHSKHRDKVLAAGSSLGLADDQQPMDAALKERDKLSKLQGRDFDKEFARYMVDDHRKDLGEYRKAARMTGPVGKMARGTIPTLQKHLSEAEKIKG